MDNDAKDPPQKLAKAVRRSVTQLQRRLRQERPAAALALSQIGILGHLHERGSLTPGALAAIDGLQPQSVTRVVASLEEDGLIDRFPGTGDKREAHLAITTAGRKALAADMAPRDKWLARQLHDTMTYRQQFTLRSAVNLLNRLAGLPIDERLTAIHTKVKPAFGWGSAAPIFPSSNLARTMDLFRRLGFRCDFIDGDGYAILDCNGVELHYTASNEHDPLVRAGRTFIEIDDADPVRDRLLEIGVPSADAFFESLGSREPDTVKSHWEAGNSLARVTDIGDKEWNVREFALADPDNNLIRFGKVLPEQNEERGPLPRE